MRSDKELLRHLQNIDRIYEQESKRLKKKVVLEYISDIVLASARTKELREFAVEIMDEYLR